MRVHYPRTPHLPWSPGVSPDDVRAGGLPGLEGREVVVTEKLDGENTTLYADGLHARSLDSAHHPSRAWVKALHGRIARSIPTGWRVCGENLYARHSIGYDDLESWFYAFSVWDGEHCLDWDRTVRFARGLGVPVPRVLWRGVFDERALRALRVEPARQEGYVVRTAEGFRREEFARRVAKWVRPGHVQTDEHWMLAPVVENGLSPAAALWEVRSGAPADVPSLLAAVGVAAGEPHGLALAETSTAAAAASQAAASRASAPPATAVERAEAVVADVSARLDLLGRTGDARLAGVLAALFHGAHRGWLAPRLVASLGVPLARRTADLADLHAGLHLPFPDEARRTGLVRLAAAADLGILHAVAAAVLAGRGDGDAAEAREQVAWSELHAEEAGLLGEAPLEPLRAGLRRVLGRDSGTAGPRRSGPAAPWTAPGGGGRDAADRCWAETREAYALGRIATAEEAAALTWRWRSGDFPRLVVMVGPSGSGKSTFARSVAGTDAVVSLDDLRQARGSRSDQRANPEVLREGLRRLDALLAGGGTAVWDATALNRHQRSLVQAVARRRDALTTHAVMLVPDGVLARRNAARAHPVPPEVLSAQLRRFSPPAPGEAHRTWYIGAEGDVRDVAGALDGEEG
ncbi:AAA family ATPase [Planomonospora sp. ID67723]|uniref:RNA ligase family protein n=1 Tax=Planomonospora sp. ID67723 TaxID=2738134 RepID=UPI0018C37334|nr:RNA ligase family protein [Planomonospora sp. ID67723]MBG0830265.1 AAA family ATPase [Planomonospora sp. ID67723]